MKPRTIRILLAVTFVTFICALEGKSLYPEIFGKSFIQWVAAGITAILMPIGLFCSAYNLFSGNADRKESGASCIAFVMLFSLIMGIYCAITPLMMRMSETVKPLSSAEVVPPLVSKLYAPETSAKKRHNYAEAVFVFSGVVVPYLGEDGSYVIYQPTPNDRDHWATSQKNESQVKSIKAVFDEQLKQVTYLSLTYIGAFLLTFLTGILFLMYGKRTVAPR